MLEGRTHTDSFRVRRRQYNIGGLNLTKVFRNGVGWGQAGAFILGFLFWTMPVHAIVGVPFVAFGGISLAVLFGPPLFGAWAADRPLRHEKTVKDLVSTFVRNRLTEAKAYSGFKPADSTTYQLSATVWTTRTPGGGE